MPSSTRPGALSEPNLELPLAAPPPVSSPAQLAKGALRRLAVDKLEPTPDNYARAYRHEAGDASDAAPLLPERAVLLIERIALRAFDADADHGSAGAAGFSQAMANARWDQAERALEAAAVSGGAAAWAALMERVVRGVERSGKNWTAGRKKESLQRVLSSSRTDARRLQQRLSQLLGGWESDSAESLASVAGAADAGTDPALLPLADAQPPVDVAPAAAPSPSPPPPPWDRALTSLGGTVQRSLPEQDGRPHLLATELAGLGQRILDEGLGLEHAAELERMCGRADGVLLQRNRLQGELGALCAELTESLTDLAENDSWARGQCDAMRVRIEEGLTSRGVRTVSDLLRTTRERQSQLRGERERARDSLKTLINRMLSELDELGSQTGNFHDSVGRYADVIDSADSLESLAGVVREMVEESRTVQALVQQTQQRLRDEHAKATSLTQRVGELELEMRRLSDEVATDQLTQIANRRGLMQAFEAEQARTQRNGSTLAIGLLDIDNFKRLNDELGHTVGDEALKSLAGVVSRTLRPTDLVARYGGEEFVVLLPDTAVEEGQQILTRLQRSLSVGLFMHENKQVFVTFSAGVTAYRSDERIEDALERADQALYEAKRTGKNRTCMA